MSSDDAQHKIKISCHGCSQKLDVTDLAPFIKILCPSCQTELIIPLPFGNLLFEENLGVGEIATVYRSMDMTLDREVAVKVLSPRFAKDQQIQDDFIKEARTASTINHPNIIPIYSCGEMEGKPYLVMQFMEGGNLLKFTKPSRKAEINEMCGWFLDAAKGLESAAVHGVLHRDVSPNNIFRDADGNVKIGDLGLFRAIYGEEPLMDNGQPAGGITLRHAYYVSPERITSGTADVKADIYSFGATMYHVATGQLPFDGEDVGSVLQARMEGLPQAPNTIRGDIAQPLSDVIMKCLSVYPSDRPTSYAEIADVLSEMRGEGESKTKPPTAKKKKKSAPPSDEKTITVPKKKFAAKPAGNRQPAVYAAPPSAAWGPRIVLIAIILGLMLFMVMHALNPPWYEKNIRPLFQATPPAALIDYAGG
jgi:serine/threonine-protein kinase